MHAVQHAARPNAAWLMLFLSLLCCPRWHECVTPLPSAHGFELSACTPILGSLEGILIVPEIDQANGVVSQIFL